MKSLFSWVAAYFANQGLLVTPVQVRDRFREEFDKFRPRLAERRWPVPATDEGRSVCLDLFCATYGGGPHGG